MNTLLQVLHSTWLGVCFIIVFSAGWTSHYWLTKHQIDNEHPPSCVDQPHRTAWLAKKDGRYRCFQEYNAWPNRAYGYFILDEPENNYSTPIEFVQREFRFDFSETSN